MKTKATTVYVDNQDKALRLYQEVPSFARKADFGPGPFRWQTVASPEEPEGTELQPALLQRGQQPTAGRTCPV